MALSSPTFGWSCAEWLRGDLPWVEMWIWKKSEPSKWRTCSPPKKKLHTHSAVLNCFSWIFIVRLTCLRCLWKSWIIPLKEKGPPNANPDNWKHPKLQTSSNPTSSLLFRSCDLFFRNELKFWSVLPHGSRVEAVLEKGHWMWLSFCTAQIS